MKTIDKQILHLAWPAIATNITTPLLSLIDVAIVGHIEGGALIAAVAVGGTVINILYWLFGFLRMGTSGMTAQAYGADDKRRQRLVLMRGLFIAVAGAMLILILSAFLGFELIDLVNGGEASTELAWVYFEIAIFGCPGMLVTYVVSGWLLGMQRSRSIMWIALSTNILNIILSIVFVFGLHWGIRGVALGTAIAQISGAVIGMCVVRKLMQKEGIDNYLFRDIFTDAKAWRSMFQVNRDIFFRTVCLASVTLWFTHAGALLGEQILAANALLMQLFMLFSYFMDGFAFGGEALAGRYYGANDIMSLRRTIKSLFRWGVWTAIVFTILYFVAGEAFMTLLTNDDKVLEVASDFKLWAVSIPLAGFAAFTWDGIQVGLTQTRYLLISMVISMLMFFAIYFIGKSITELDNFNHILWLAFVVYLAIRGVVSTLLYQRFVKTLSC